jgi:hypothetical protein
MFQGPNSNLFWTQTSPHLLDHDMLGSRHLASRGSELQLFHGSLYVSLDEHTFIAFNQ